MKNLIYSYRFSYTFSSYALLILLIISCACFSSCSITKFPVSAEECKIWTYINEVVPDYISRRYPSGQHIRVAVVPFDVPESFALWGNESKHFGRELAASFQSEMIRLAEGQIVEVLNVDRWPGKRAEFLTGNYNAIDMARSAGFDFVLLGYMQDITNESDIVVQTKFVDVSNNITVWHAQTTVKSNQRLWRRNLAKGTFGIVEDHPELFAFQERKDLLVKCTVKNLLTNTTLPSEQKTEEQKLKESKNPLPLPAQ